MTQVQPIVPRCRQTETTGHNNEFVFLNEIFVCPCSFLFEKGKNTGTWNILECC